MTAEERVSEEKRSSIWESMGPNSARRLARVVMRSRLALAQEPQNTRMEFPLVQMWRSKGQTTKTKTNKHKHSEQNRTQNRIE